MPLLADLAVASISGHVGQSARQKEALKDICASFEQLPKVSCSATVAGCSGLKPLIVKILLFLPCQARGACQHGLVYLSSCNLQFAKFSNVGGSRGCACPKDNMPVELHCSCHARCALSMYWKEVLAVFLLVAPLAVPALLK